MLRLTTVMLFLCLVLFQLSETKRSKSSIVSKTGIKSIKGKSFKGKTNPKGSEIKWQKQATMGRRRRSGKRKTKRLKIRKRNRNTRYFRQKLNLFKNKKRKCWRKNSNRKKKGHKINHKSITDKSYSVCVEFLWPKLELDLFEYKGKTLLGQGSDNNVLF